MPAPRHVCNCPMPPLRPSLLLINVLNNEPEGECMREDDRGTAANPFAEISPVIMLHEFQSRAPD